MKTTDLIVDKTQNEKWFLYPENVPIFYDEMAVSRPLLFATETDDGTHIRLGAFHDQAGGFVESGDSKRTVYTAHSVRSFYEFPFPPAGLKK